MSALDAYWGVDGLRHDMVPASHACCACCCTTGRVSAAYRPSLPLSLLRVRLGSCSILQSHTARPKGSGSWMWRLSDIEGSRCRYRLGTYANGCLRVTLAGLQGCVQHILHAVHREHATPGHGDQTRLRLLPWGFCTCRKHTLTPAARYSLSLQWLRQGPVRQAGQRAWCSKTAPGAGCCVTALCS
jgi:hypothetical protein